MNLHLALLLGYSLLLVAIGFWLGRRVRGTADFFVAGRRLGPGLLGATVLAANIGAGSTVGAASLGYRDGLSAWWWVGSAGLGSIALAWWVGPAIRREAARHNLHTVGDYLEHRYGASIRATISIMLWCGTLFILAGQLVAFARILEVVAGVPKPVGCFLGGAVMTSYFAAGGLLTSASVNLVQLVVLVMGFLIALPVALSHAGGGGVLLGVAPTETYWNFWRGGASGWPYFAMLAPAFIVSPGLLQKAYGGRDDRAVRLGIGANAAALLIFAFLPVILGMTARVAHPMLPHHELALPTLLMEDLPPAAGSLVLAALFSAEISSADAILFMLATSLSQDLYRRFVNRRATDRQVLTVARAAAVAGGALGVALAIAAETIIDALAIFYTLLTVSLFVPLLAGLYTRRAGVREAGASIAAGVLTMLVIHLTTGGRGLGPLTPALAGLVGAAGAFGLAGVTQRGRRRPEVPEEGV